VLAAVTVRRLLSCLVLALSLAACGPQRSTELDPRFDMDAMNRQVAAIAARAAPARLTVAFMDLENGEVWSRFGDTAMPMQSVFELVLGAAVLAEVDAGRLSLDETVVIGEEDLSPQPSGVATGWPAVRSYTVGELLARAVRGSDNTAADVLMKRIGGPGAVTSWLANRRIAAIRVDRYERQIQMEIAGLGSFRPAWKDAAPVAAVPEPARRAALTAFLSDPQDTATAHAVIGFLNRLDAGELLSPGSRRLLLQMMEETPAGSGRIAAALPEGARLAHKTGTARPDLGLSPVINDVGIATLPDGRRYAIAILMSGCRGDLADCERVLAQVTDVLIDEAG
jgi:beta-lactamase class A